MSYKVYAQSAPWSRAVEFLVTEESQGRRSVGASLVMQLMEEGCANPPTFCLSYEEAQFLMDELWNCGLRPSEGTGSAGALAATQKHLEDMRRLVFEGKVAV